MKRIVVLLLAWSMLGAIGSALWGDENPMPVISSPTIHAIEFSGNTSIPTKKLEKRLPIKRGGWYDPQEVSFSRDMIESIYRDQGFVDVHVTSKTTDVPPRSVDIFFPIEEGPLYRIRSVKIIGNHLLSDRLIHRDLGLTGLKPGEPFSQTKLYDTNKALFLSGYFEKIDIHFDTAPAHEMDVIVQVKERSTQFAKGGFGYGTQTKERLSVGYEDRNFFGNERQLDVSGVYSGFLTNPAKYRTRILQTTLVQPHIFDSAYVAQTGISEEWDDRLPYDSRTTAWRSSLGRHFGPAITASMRYRFQGTAITRIDPSQAGTTPGFTNISAVGPTFTYDNTNDPFLPTQGWRIAGLVEKGLTWGLGDINFERYEAHAGRFETLHQMTFFGGLQFGLVTPDNPNDTIPIYERYTLGGANTVRGYEQEELGARDAQGNPTGGNEFLVGNLEARHRLYKQLYGVWFLDGGQLYVQNQGENWPYMRMKSIGDFNYGTGPGIRLQTPVGAIRLEWGYKLNPGGSEDFLDHTAIDFSFGEVF